MAIIDIKRDLDSWFASVEQQFVKLIRTAVKEVLREILSEELVDAIEAAKILKMTPGAVRKAAQRGGLKHQKINGRLRSSAQTCCNCKPSLSSRT